MWYPPCVKWQRGDRKVFFALLLLPFGGTAFWKLLFLSVGIVVAVRGIVVLFFFGLPHIYPYPRSPHARCTFGRVGQVSSHLSVRELAAVKLLCIERTSTATAHPWQELKQGPALPPRGAE